MSRLPPRKSAVDPPAPRRVTPSVLAREPERVMMIVAALSVVLHVLAVVFAYQQPLGEFTPSAQPRRTTVLNVRQASPQPWQLPTGRQGLEPGDEGPALEDLSLALLEQDELAPAAEALPEQALELRPIEEVLPDAALDVEAAALPTFELPESAFAEALGDSPREPDFQAGSGLDGEAGDRPGAGTGDGSGASEAQRLLAEAGFGSLGGGGGLSNPQPSGRAAPRDEAPTAVLDERMLDMAMDAPVIDFASEALASTTQLVVPEQLDHDFDYFISRYQPRGEPGYFRLDVVARQSLRRLHAMPKDVVFLIDTSDSVPQDWVRQIVRGVNQALHTLNAEDRFNIVLFSDAPAFFSTDGPADATAENIAAAQEFLVSAKSEGWTDLHGALSRLLVRDLEQQRVYNLILISDGTPTRGVLDNRELINVITRDNDLSASIYAIGVGRQPNRELLDFVAYRNNGFCLFVDHIGRVASTVRDLVSRLRYPLITDVKVRVAGEMVSEVYPLNLPNIHQGERFSLFGRFDELGEFTVQITGRNGPRQVDFTFRRDLSLAAEGGAQIATDWAFWKLHHLYSEIIREGETGELVRQIHELRRRYRLRTLY